MSLIRESNTRQSVFADAMLAVMTVGRENGVFQVDAEAMRLLGEHPGCPVSIDELKAYLMRFAWRENVPMAVG